MSTCTPPPPAPNLLRRVPSCQSFAIILRRNYFGSSVLRRRPKIDSTKKRRRGRAREGECPKNCCLKRRKKQTKKKQAAAQSRAETIANLWHIFILGAKHINKSRREMGKRGGTYVNCPVECTLQLKIIFGKSFQILFRYINTIK